MSANERSSKPAGGKLLSVAETAKFLRVSPSTVWRWINAGRLRAYRVGPKRVRLREDDVQQLCEQPRLPFNVPRKLTAEQRERGLAALEQLRLLREELQRKNDGKLFEPESWVLINEARDQRSRERS